MSFLVTAALAVALLVGVPIAAHLLRRSRAEEVDFPPTALVPAAQPVARKRRRLEDRLLLALRGAMIVALAVLGATPLIRCSRLSLSREAGGSVALALVLDDSLSMRAVTGDRTRFERAVAGARELLDATREGDAVAIVLAGGPARLALAATTDLEHARRTLKEIEPSDRGTDLGAAVQIARSALKQLPHRDHRLVVLSDLAADDIPPGDPPVAAPLPNLRGPMHDCGIVVAERSGRRVAATVACSSAHAARDRKLELVSAKGAGGGSDAGTAKLGETLGSAPLEIQSGSQIVSIELPSPAVNVDARLTGSDAIAADDVAPVTDVEAGLTVGIVADPSTASVTTGGPTILEQAMQVLPTRPLLRPMTVLPDRRAELDPLVAVILDDPSGIAAEARSALNEWISSGRVALAMLGPAAGSSQLGSTLEPFAVGAVRWEETKPIGLDPKSVSWLGVAGESLADLGAKRRTLLAGARPANSTIAASFADGAPFLVETRIGRGLVLATALPVSVEHSDFALRPGFLALLDYVVEQAARRSGPRRSAAGERWAFPAGSEVSIEGPRGPIALAAGEGESADAQKGASVALAGRYRVSVDGEVHERVVTISEQEVLRQSRDPSQIAADLAEVASSSSVDASRELAWLLLALFGVEALARVLRRPRRRQERREARVGG